MNNLTDIFFAPTANQELTYEQILEDVQRYFAEHHASTIAEAGDGNAERAASLLKELMIPYIVKRKYAIEVIEAGGRSVKIPDKFSSPQHAIDVVRRMLNACGMVIDDTMPSVIGFLDKNVRISVDKMPIVDPEVGINASIRIVNQQTVSEEKLLDSGSTTAEMLHFLTACIRYRITIRGWEKMLTAATAAVPSDETISRSAAVSIISNSPSAAAGHANRQNSLRMSIGDQRISGLDAQTDSVVENDPVKLRPHLPDTLAGQVLQPPQERALPDAFVQAYR